MGKIHIFTYSLILCIVLSLALLAFVFCILAEFKKSKAKDVKLDGRLCQLPESEAFWFGIAALICISTAQIIGNSMSFVVYCQDAKERRLCSQIKRPTITSILLLISWYGSYFQE
ncbi:protein MODIFYING WALL LIGNIN-1 isoform X2 [Beta vulgaris subsp. vulgaris]|uniref:protein MODIFYING WALL LIGNIN-1 isoform X2 n=1 Tax=Beta vulgaris subsp. vulgaris TaxID=3555 RepID=UPI00053FC6DD|nr:protein MODIFYING WALL LIGNIN-1 isoform X2 [Beta vulgaris subsp. vulgaris]